MRSVIISCRTIKAEVEQAIEVTGYTGPVFYLESGLHNEPEKLKVILQETLDRFSNIDQVLLVMGYCGNAVMSLKPEGFRLVIPRADDCITMLLGSQKRRQEVQREAPTYFFSRGWLDYWDDLERPIVEEYGRIIVKYGRERAERLMRSMYHRYKRLGIIDTGTFDMDQMLEKAKLRADFLKLDYEVIPGTMDYFHKFLTGPWEDGDFILIRPGETVVPEHLYGRVEAEKVHA